MLDKNVPETAGLPVQGLAAERSMLMNLDCGGVARD